MLRRYGRRWWWFTTHHRRRENIAPYIFATFTSPLNVFKAFVGIFFCIWMPRSLAQWRRRSTLWRLLLLLLLYIACCPCPLWLATKLSQQQKKPLFSVRAQARIRRIRRRRRKKFVCKTAISSKYVSLLCVDVWMAWARRGSTNHQPPE